MTIRITSCNKNNRENIVNSMNFTLVETIMGGFDVKVDVATSPYLKIYHKMFAQIDNLDPVIHQTLLKMMNLCSQVHVDL